MVDHLNAFNQFGHTPLIAAIVQNDDNIVDILLRHNADPNKNSQDDQITPMHEILRLLPHSGQNGQNIFSMFLETPRLDINKQNINGDTPLTYALKHCTIDIVLRILDHNYVDVNIRDSQFKSPLMLGLYDRDVVRELVFKGADVNAITPVGTSIVEMLFQTQIDSLYKESVTIPCMNHLMSSMARLNITADAFRLIIDCETMEPPYLETLLLTSEDRLNIDLGPNSQGLDCLCYAAISDNVASMLLLLRYLTDYNMDQLVFCSVQSQNGSTAQHLMTMGADFNIVDIYGNAPLTYAILAKSLECIKLLLTRSVGYETTAQGYATLLIAIIQFQNMDVVKWIATHTAINLAKPEWLLENSDPISPLEYLIQKTDPSLIDVTFVRQYLTYASPRFGFVGFVYKPPQWFIETVGDLYNKYNKLAYRCITSANPAEFKQFCSTYDVPYSSP
ncbi:Serine/threonine-protein phosphatase 6 regulatory ankyrin repeat subunit B [Scale drop disease virus]|uniref:ORF_108R n=1 Tax=Scale drop disease virus TaxID=1697349 RepID=A0A0K1L6Y6_9VIRU|nr:ORF_108R [Scale drop disease virus]AKU37523.1 ORF_108R [Scale drop disease virus]QLI60780.1 Serine/threonine-protein phosphatase 6 regulatory ankyrin repeat subunit B [Scale drop disease virus]QXJ13698.1 ORF108R [Scale drop disease virus]UNH60675.1 Serine/threonine-protein phosphatase 6 regulatory ankyrin repeat subunit B [Scale drop disease virus]